MGKVGFEVHQLAGNRVMETQMVRMEEVVVQQWAAFSVDRIT
jgi:hypothetical protein